MITQIRKTMGFSYVKNDRGFTLLEALMAMIFISVAMLATGSLLASITGFNRHARQRTAATTLAQDKMEKIVNLAYTAIVAASFPDETGLDEDGNTGGDAVYDRTTEVDGAFENMKIIRVKVEWNPYGGTSRSVELRTAVAK